MWRVSDMALLRCSGLKSVFVLHVNLNLSSRTASGTLDPDTDDTHTDKGVQAVRQKN